MEVRMIGINFWFLFATIDNEEVAANESTERAATWRCWPDLQHRVE